ncbi:MAG: dimethyl sulfoxide reductase anchor subunit, partial [Rhodobacteraceae bacterium]|nr:dimethyl sulfoxide reductase anchor subunit [Paracoccaceae bacterium]
MHPAYSVIVFTTASGAGYGLLFWLSLAHLAGMGERWTSLAAMILALALITLGLLSSTLHLGRPERALGAFSQWRSSWLSREGVVAVATYVPSGLLALIWMFGLESSLIGLLALLSAIGAAATVYCTGMIYASLRTIRQWHLSLTPAGYLALAAATGGVLFGLVAAAFGQAHPAMATAALVSVAIAAGVKLSYWREIDGDPGRYTIDQAIGLGSPGGVKPLDPPHTRPNFVMREMGYQVARKHAVKLRTWSIVALFAAPTAAMLLLLITGWGAPLFYLVATVSAAVGVMMERWLFFAEADHVSMLYYGVQRA